MPTLPSQIAGAPTRTLSVWANHYGLETRATVGTSNGRLMVFPLCPADGVLPGVMTANTMLIGMFGVFALAASAAHTLSMNLGVYTLANSTQLSLLNSVSTSMGTSAAATANSSLMQGPRQIQLVSSQWSTIPSFTRTQYWLGLQFLSSGVGIPVSISGFQWMHSNFSGIVGVGNTAAPSATVFPGLGVHSSTFTSVLPSAIAMSDVRRIAQSLCGAIPSIVVHNIGA